MVYSTNILTCKQCVSFPVQCTSHVNRLMLSSLRICWVKSPFEAKPLPHFKQMWLFTAPWAMMSAASVVTSIEFNTYLCSWCNTNVRVCLLYNRSALHRIHIYYTKRAFLAILDLNCSRGWSLMWMSYTCHVKKNPIDSS